MATKKVFLLTLVMISLQGLGYAQQEESTERRAVLDVDRRAKHLFDKAIELMEYKQYERGLTMLDTVIRDNEGNVLGYQAHMAKGRHFLEQRKTKEALSHFLLLSRLLTPLPGDSPSPQETELYRESLFQAGFSYYQSGQYTSAFPMFRRLTEVAGKSKWANKAYYYIGMSHYNLRSWNKAIDALSLVGTEVEATSSDEIGRVELGQRFYAKVSDADIPVLRKVGQDVMARVTVSSGDSEVLTGVPIAGKKNEALMSAPTEIGVAEPGDGVLQLFGGDTLTVTYVDDSTLDGSKGVKRSGTVKAVSTGTVGFFLGDFSTPAYIAFPGQPQALLLRDADLDVSPKAESVSITVKALYKVAAVDAAEANDESVLDIFAVQDDEQDVWKERDSVTLMLTERAMGKGEGGPIRTGVFTNKIKLAPLAAGTPDLNDDVLHCDELDELEVTYSDEVHLYGDEVRESRARIKVSGSVNSGVSADQFVVFEAVLKARKNAVEAEALKGLGLIYKDMGLDDRASQRADESLRKVDAIILDRNKITSELLEQAFKLKWECEILKEDFAAATATCQAFNRLYPQSVLADQALMALSRALAEKGEYAEAVTSYQRVLALQNPISAAEAQFRIGEVLQQQVDRQFEAKHKSRWTEAGRVAATERHRAMGGAIAAYRKTYQAYPESAYAAKSLSEVVRFYVDTEDFAQASDLLEQVFADFPDAAFLDEMLLLWAQVAFRMGDNNVSAQKLQQLVFDYPSSQHVAEAQKKLAALKQE
ncbi:MAG: tetratricopeptide repeat protein [Rubripirellula sp.]|nr:tetratricopeptide repeat protein [Rubripirellula sp.]